MGDAIDELLFGNDHGACTKTLLARLNDVSMLNFSGAIKQAGTGIYLLYYVGPHALYNGLSEDCPMYIGKAIGDGGSRTQLELRLRDHQKSLRQADDLRPTDFRYKVLRINEEWVAGCETVLIKHWLPLWNTVVTGFGNHAPGKGRRLQRKSLWDTLHTGRNWANMLDPELPYSRVAEQVQEWCDARGYPARWPIRELEGQIEDQFNCS